MDKVMVVAEVRPSEDKEKVINAVSNFFTYEKIREDSLDLSLVLRFESDTLKSLMKVHKALREEKILDASRKYLLRGLEGDKITFMIHKQAAAVRVLTFVDTEDESPLGPIKFFIKSEKARDIIDWLAPKTSHGKPLWENPMP
ncbi:RNA-binding domain-containing protein [Sulfuracidifex metallicus]|uniref:UPF0201 protein GC250_11110 n=1 Tax=Sulfuracidifex metallicus DSM 6482 = JCM 9184 TaxID=523847 RepID=A0A6A9QL08_SULME|nr:RNA-binding domain-containing protein [Sulfuracidifex metallicus]MCY0849767.1 hypothetical protein [Sulfuracidifex metallicus]MUN29967.1 hypothetical protein [Sulfuracidifex metallicus DSM 6482 = JCM 9184]WOE51650.1 RNA-binding domain-containing protein [Sulfuracidifex metallicus DSM 6482 = JCM 9184]